MTRKASNSLRVLVIASSNEGKVKEFQRLLPLEGFSLEKQPEHFDIEETGETFAENARLKALAVAKETGQIALADDSGLCVEALGGAPGVRSARYATSDKARINRLLGELEGVENRKAFFAAALCIAFPNKEFLLEVEGRCEGTITRSPRGTNGFGYDPIFEALGHELTFAELDSTLKSKISHRGRAIALIKPRLQELIYRLG